MEYRTLSGCGHAAPCPPDDLFDGMCNMPRPRERVRLEDGFKLDINRLARRGFIRPGAKTGPIGIAWTDSYTGQTLATGLIGANMQGDYEGWFRIQLGALDQWIVLLAQPRHFGGRQWYFSCPVTRRLVSVLWKPPGASRFCSRHNWERQAAYASQFEGRDDRAWRGKRKIKARLAVECDPDDWDLPPKPKWMRWRTYQRYVDKYDHYEGMLDEGTIALVARLMGRA
jgi:hypothetical protein